MATLKKNIIYNFAYEFLTFCFPLIVTPYISRVLGPEGIGVYSFYYSVAQYFVLFAALGLKNYGTRAISGSIYRENRTELSKLFFEIFWMQFCCALVVNVAYCAYILFFKTDRAISLVFYLYVVSSFFDISWFFSGMEQFKLIFTRNIIIKAASTAAIFLFVKGRGDIAMYCVIMAGSILLSQLSLWLYLRRYVSFERILLARAFRIHFIPNLKLFIPVIAVSIYKYMDKIMIGTMSSKMELGYYENVEKLVNIPVAFVTALGTVMLSRISYLYSRGDIRKSNAYMHTSIMFTWFISAGMIFGIICVLDVFVPLFFGPGYEKCIQLSYIMLPTVFFLGISNVMRTQYLIPCKKDNVFILSVCIGAVVNFVLNSLLIGPLQSVGAAIGTLAAEFSVFLYQYVLCRREIGIQRELYGGIGFGIAAGIMALLVSRLPMMMNSPLITLVIRIAIGFVIYTVLAFGYVSVAMRDYRDLILGLLRKRSA